MAHSRARTASALVLLVITALIGSVLGIPPAVAQVHASAASAWQPTTLPAIPAGPDTNGFASISCPADGACVALGSSSSRHGDIVQTLRNGRWTTTSLPLPSVGPTGFVSLTAISCVSITSCVAVGSYRRTYLPPHPYKLVLERLHNGRWSYSIANAPGRPGGVSCTAVETCEAIGSDTSTDADGRPRLAEYHITRTSVTTTYLPLPTDLTDLHSVVPDGISCASSTSCTAVATAVSADEDDFFGNYPVAETLSGTTWTASDLPTPDGAGRNNVSSVSCPTTTTCVAIEGVKTKYPPEYGEFYAVRIAGGVVTTTPIRHATVLYAVSCADAENCVAVGAADPKDFADPPNTPATAVFARGRWTVSRLAYPYGSSGTRSYLPAVDCATAGFCVGVGDLNTPADSYRNRFLAETLQGGRWKASEAGVIPGPADGSLSGLSCQSANSCVAVGSYLDAEVRARPLAETLTAGSWTPSTLPLPSGGISATVDGVSCVAADTCTAVGQYVDATGRAALLAESLSGGTWTPREIALDPAFARHQNLTGVVCLSATSCVAVGDYSNPRHAGSSYPVAAVLSGATWTTTRLPNNGVVGGVSCQSVRLCVAVGAVPGSDYTQNRIPQAWTLSGSTWTAHHLPYDANGYGRLTSVSCSAIATCTAVGGAYYRSFAENKAGAGTGWRVTDLPTNAPLQGVSCVAADSCTAVGRDGATPAVDTRTSPGWTTETLASPDPAAQSSVLNAVQCFTASTCVAVGAVHTTQYAPPAGYPLIETRTDTSA